jgi:molybdenum cofactor biosynthesis enzyme MoaA
MYMTPDEIKAFQPFPAVRPSTDGGANARSRKRMQEAGVWADNQILGRRYPVGCVALEITQRCNLDCTLCYLSEHSESTKDLPLEEVFRRIEQIRFHFGPGTDVQITGGDPTLRNREELIQIVRKIRDIGMRPTLMTNGKLATRSLVSALVDAGLNDLAIHVDMTQERKGYASEVELNKVRKDYIERVRGLPLAVIFNTTVFKGNFHEIPDLVRFFRENCDVVGMASFQMQADTGRGTLHKRDDVITLDNMVQKIEEGAGTKISFETARIGHPRCHRYGLTLQVGGKTFDLFDSSKFFNLLVEKTTTLELDRAHPTKAIIAMVKWLATTPSILVPGVWFMVRKVWAMKGALIRGRGKMRKLSFFMQNFMDASQLEADRIHACSFMVMTGKGPISMCMHNAKRDEFILQPVRLESQSGKLWNPLTGKVDEPVVIEGPVIHEESARG